MAGQPYIAPKPTTYKGVRYRSRLEAGWAIFWENVSPGGRGRLSVEYESFSVGTYRPDFAVSWDGDDGDEVGFLMEVKPCMPNREYRDQLCKTALEVGLAKGVNLPLLLAVGSFYVPERPPQFYLMPYNDWFALTMDDFVPGWQSAAEAVRRMRWDLHRE